MICRTTLALGAMALVSLASSAAMAQNAPPSYEGDPDVYKVIFSPLAAPHGDIGLLVSHPKKSL